MKLINTLKIRTDRDKHRQATWLELFIDLAYVVGIASLVPLFKDGFTIANIIEYSIYFFVVFWMWNKYTWFATYYDNNDVFFRFAYLFSILPVIGFVNSFDKISQGDFTQAILSYIGANLILLVLWGRVILKTQSFKTNARFFFYGYFISTILFVMSLFLSNELKYYMFVTGIIIEIISPILGWKFTKGRLPVHNDHIIERHGLFSIIILGEGVASISHAFELISTIYWPLLLLGFLLVILVWWIYFDCGFGFKTHLSRNLQKVFVFGYGHFFVFLALAFIPLGLEHTLHDIVHKTHHTEFMPSSFMTVSLGMLLIVLSAIQLNLSSIKLKRIYAVRIITGIILLSLSFFVTNPVALLIISVILYLSVVINEIYSFKKQLKKS